jgi:hypothetical protein
VAKHTESKRGFGKYEISIGGGGGDGEEPEIFTYDIDPENDSIVNFERLEDSKAKAKAKREKAAASK